jgi:hypothetical protein
MIAAALTIAPAVMIQRGSYLSMNQATPIPVMPEATKKQAVAPDVAATEKPSDDMNAFR